MKTPPERPDHLDGRSLPTLRTEVPGPCSRRLVDDLARTECPAITARRSRREEQGGVEQDPIVWERARGANVMDADRNVYVDLTSAFGVAGLGHTHPRVVEAACGQADRLIHAMGDVYPSRAKITLCNRLAQLTPGDLEVSMLGSSGADAVEAALKTAVVATGRSTIIAFSESYHGMSYGALVVSGYRDAFRRPIRAQLGDFGTHVPYANCYRCPLGKTYPECEVACLALVEEALDARSGRSDDPHSERSGVAAVIVEPIQGRGGIVVPPEDWLTGLQRLCTERGILLIFDEIFTGFGRTGRWFGAEHSGVTPDLMCLGKAMGGGFPISAAIGTRQVMTHWGLSAGEAIHTSTFLGNPLGCAMALATLETLEAEDLVSASGSIGEQLEARLEWLKTRHPVIGDVRGRGSLRAVELVLDRKTKEPAPIIALRVVRALLERGFLVLPSGAFGNVVAIVPPFVLTDAQLAAFCDAFDEVLTIWAD